MEPKDVVKKATDHLASVVLDTSKVANLRVEEIFRENGHWIVTLSYDAIGEYAFDRKREYKEFKIIDTSGAVEYMKIKPGT